MKKIFIFVLLFACSFLFLKQKVKAAEVEINYIYVDLKGAVEAPGVYKISANSRVFQLVEIAGGLLEESNTRNINLASKLSDAMIIYIPFLDEEGEKSEMVNINTASLEELDKELIGVGPETAQNIIIFREENGPFLTIEDLKNVSGIGNSIFEQNKERLTV